MLVFKKTYFECLENQGILATLFTICRTVLYFTGIFMLNGKQLLNNNDTQIFPKNVVYSQDDKGFYKCLNECGGTFTKIFMITIQG